MDWAVSDAYISILKKELLLAEGCTEPAAIAYAAALARKALGSEPERLEVQCSRGVVKNANSVVVPNLGGMRGIRAAAVAGALGGDADKKMEVIAGFNQALLPRLRQLSEGGFCSVSLLESDAALHIVVCAYAGDDCAKAELKHKHDQVVCLEKNGRALHTNDKIAGDVEGDEPYTLNLADIFQFAHTVECSRIAPLLERQLRYNIAICEEGLSRKYGAGIGRMIMSDSNDTDVERRACAYAAAGSDARMSGCPMAVVINSGSGNQGITVTAPVWVYAKHLGVPDETLLRALAISNLVAIYIKSLVGRLSAYCGAVSAASGSGAGITYLYGGSYEQVANTVSNALVNISGIMCDGAKPSCAAKIASSVQAAIIGHRMAMAKNNFHSGDGVTGDTPEETLQNIGRLASEGLKKMDRLMLDILLKQ